MKYYWAVNAGASSVLIFCNGWGMDYRPFIHLGSKTNDVMLLYDYRTLEKPPELLELFNNYSVISLVGWSMGVWVGQYLFAEFTGKIDQAIAINGTLKPIDDRFGIPRALFDKTLENYDQNGQERFYRRMCREKDVLETFKSSPPERTIADQREELEQLKQMTENNHLENTLYSSAIISQKDLVMPTAGQELFWKDTFVVTISGCHFPFTRWQSWDDIVQLAACRG